jgi:hypothetical protein
MDPRPDTTPLPAGCFPYLSHRLSTTLLNTPFVWVPQSSILERPESGANKKAWELYNLCLSSPYTPVKTTPYPTINNAVKKHVGIGRPSSPAEGAGNPPIPSTPLSSTPCRPKLRRSKLRRSKACEPHNQCLSSSDSPHINPCSLTRSNAVKDKYNSATGDWDRVTGQGSATSKDNGKAMDGSDNTSKRRDSAHSITDTLSSPCSLARSNAVKQRYRIATGDWDSLTGHRGDNSKDNEEIMDGEDITSKRRDSVLSITDTF